MAQIMDFILNLLLFNGKFLTSAAARSVHEAIRRCMVFRSQLSVEYNKATSLVGPYENMLEMINQHSLDSVQEDENYVNWGKIRGRLYEQVSHMAKQEMFNKAGDKNQNDIKWLSTERSLKTTNGAQKDSEKKELLKAETEKKFGADKKQCDYLIDNLSAILKSQEYLFKNIRKLISMLEKDKKEIDGEKLMKIKKKLVACTEILSNSALNYRHQNYTEELVDEEVTSCRFTRKESNEEWKVGQGKSQKVIIHLQPPLSVRKAVTKEVPVKANTVKKAKEGKSMKVTVSSQRGVKKVRRPIAPSARSIKLGELSSQRKKIEKRTGEFVKKSPNFGVEEETEDVERAALETQGRKTKFHQKEDEVELFDKVPMVKTVKRRLTHTITPKEVKIEKICEVDQTTKNFDSEKETPALQNGGIPLPQPLKDDFQKQAKAAKKASSHLNETVNLHVKKEINIEKHSVKVLKPSAQTGVDVVPKKSIIEIHTTPLRTNKNDELKTGNDTKDEIINDQKESKIEKLPLQTFKIEDLKESYNKVDVQERVEQSMKKETEAGDNGLKEAVPPNSFKKSNSQKELRNLGIIKTKSVAKMKKLLKKPDIQKNAEVPPQLIQTKPPVEQKQTKVKKVFLKGLILKGEVKPEIMKDATLEKHPILTKKLETRQETKRTTSLLEANKRQRVQDPIVGAKTTKENTPRDKLDGVQIENTGSVNNQNRVIFERIVFGTVCKKCREKESSRIDLDYCCNLGKVIETNEMWFRHFENVLTHSQVTQKFLAIRDDYLNSCKCAYYNRRHFRSFESKLLKNLEKATQVEESEKFFVVNEAMFQIVEKRLWLDKKPIEKEPTNRELQDVEEEIRKNIARALAGEDISKIVKENETLFTKINQEMRRNVNKIAAIEEAARLIEVNESQFCKVDPKLEKLSKSESNLTRNYCERRRQENFDLFKKIGLEEKVREEKMVVDVNNQAFEDLETTLKGTKILNGRRKSLRTTVTDAKKRRIDEPTKKSMSTKQMVGPTESTVTVFGEINVGKNVHLSDSTKSLGINKTFVKEQAKVRTNNRTTKENCVVPLNFCATSHKVTEKLAKRNVSKKKISHNKEPTITRLIDNREKLSSKKITTTPLTFKKKVELIKANSRGEIKRRTTKTAMKKVSSKLEVRNENPVKIFKATKLIHRKTKEATDFQENISKKLPTNNVTVIKWEEEDVNNIVKILSD